ncbi:MAG TPA: hypothetical protein VLC52_13455, partial [Anaerolineae bacterium]|nr:hypothetical protein [Anaerolineae bacterium]
VGILVANPIDLDRHDLVVVPAYDVLFSHAASNVAHNPAACALRHDFAERDFHAVRCGRR